MPVSKDRRQTEAARQRAKARDSQDIGTIPPPHDEDRRREAESSFHFFCRTYFPAAFRLPWSDYHHSAAQRIEAAVNRGGLFAFAMPRGSGKTTVTEWATLWSVLTGRIRYVVMIGATQPDAQKRLDNVMGELQSNDALFEDFPEVCYPIWCLEREVRRCAGQKHQGQPTAITWTKEKLILPSIKIGGEWTPQSGSIVEVKGITSSIRGLGHRLESGEKIRPELAICDDPQTRESAKSVTQSKDRAATIAGDVAYLGGPDSKPIAVVMPCTVIYQGDMADQLLDREQHPEWQGERTRMVDAFPDGLLEGQLETETCRLWNDYEELRNDELRSGGDGSKATDFYRANQAVMDDGFVVSWKERFLVGEVSAIQHAMNCFFRNRDAFFSEYQNEPVSVADDEPELTDEQIATKMTMHARRTAPAAAEKITAFIDVGKSLLHWMVVAWEDGFGGHVLDYGAYPDQGSRYYSSDKPRKTIEQVHGSSFESALYAAIESCVSQIVTQDYRREDGISLPVSRLMIDANWGQSTPIVYRVCAASENKAILFPSHGKYVGAASTPWSETRRKKGEKLGHHFLLGPSSTNPGIRRVVMDVNYWKSFVYDRLATNMGDKGCLSLFRLTESHEMLAHHLNAEYRVRVVNKQSERVVDEWKARPDRPDNHWLDCLVGCAVAASIEGFELSGVLKTGSTFRSGKSYTGGNSLSALRAKKRGR